MKLRQHLLLASALCGVPFIASAADLPVKAPPMVQVVQPIPFTWTGLYVGVSGGVISEDFTATDLGSLRENEPSWNNIGDTYGLSGTAGLFGFNVGYNWQVAPNWVIGVEADLSWTGLDDSSSTNGFTVSSKLNWLGTLRGRIGYAFDRILIYGTGGLAYGNVEYKAFATNFPSYNFNKDTSTGWTAGGGLEWAFANNWTARAEALYVDFGDQIGFFPEGNSGCRFGFKNNYVLGRVGLNYKF